MMMRTGDKCSASPIVVERVRELFRKFARIQAGSFSPAFSAPLRPRRSRRESAFAHFSRDALFISLISLLLESLSSILLHDWLQHLFSYHTLHNHASKWISKWISSIEASMSSDSRSLRSCLHFFLPFVCNSNHEKASVHFKKKVWGKERLTSRNFTRFQLWKSY